jgi:pimeloyl-ACP methyl ester carboxylesterase
MRGAPMDREFALGFLAFLTPALGPGLMRRRRERLGAEGQVRATMELVCTDPSRVDPDVLAAHVEVARDRAAREWVDAAYLGSARTIVAAHAGGRSWRLVRNAPDVPTLLLHGDRDRLVAVEAARHAAALRPDWTFEVMPGVGHVPMLEAPAETLDAMRRWARAQG